METEVWLWAFLGSLARQIPTYLVYLVGLVLSLIWMRKHPKVSIFFIIALVILFINSLITTWLFLWLPNYLRDQGRPFYEISLFTTIIGVVSDLIRAGAFILILLPYLAGGLLN